MRRDCESSRLKGISGGAEALPSLGCLPRRGVGIAFAKGSARSLGPEGSLGPQAGFQAEEGDDRSGQCAFSPWRTCKDVLPQLSGVS